MRDQLRDARALDPATIAAHGLRADAPETLPEGARAVPSAEPLYQTSVFDFPSIEASDGPLAGQGGYVYSRYGLPNARSLELTMAALEGSEEALATASGMGAIACGLLAVAKQGDRLLLQEDAYGGTGALMAQDFGRFGIQLETVSAYDAMAVAHALERPAKALLVETISNPLVREVDVPALAKACKARGALLFVDNTFATPVLARPLADGADVVLHSATKFLGGHHDLCAGVLCGGAALIKEARGVARRFGMTAAPFDAWLACRGIRTLAVRMERAELNARWLVAKLRADARVTRVHYPGRGAMLSFEVASGAAASRTVAALQLVTLTPSLGGTNTTVSHAATSSHRGMSPAERRALGIADGLLRLSVGIEHVEDVWKDLEAALGA